MYNYCDKKSQNGNFLEFSHQADSLNLTLIFPLDEIFAALVLCKELQLFGVDGSTTFLTDQLDGILRIYLLSLNPLSSNLYFQQEIPIVSKIGTILNKRVVLYNPIGLDITSSYFAAVPV